MRRRRLAGWVGLVALAVLTEGARAEAPGMAELSTAEQADNPWRARFVAETGVGTGTFISSPYADDPLVYSMLTVTPIYRLTRLPFQPNLSLIQTVQMEYTQPENISDRRFAWADTRLSLSSNSLWKEENTGISLGGGLEATLPISYRSMATHKITSTTASLRAMWSRGDFMAMASGGVTKHFYRYRTEVREGEVEFDDGYKAVHCRSGQDVCIGGRYALNVSTMAGVMMAYNLTPRLAVALDMLWTGGWRLPAPNDEFTSPNARTDSRTVDMTRTLLDFSYSLNQEFSLSLGAATYQPLLSSDNKSWRNPLYDGTPRNNFTTFYFDIVYSI